MTLPAINNDWTLFLDRDGVINVEKPYDYINDWKEFVFYEGVPEAIRILSNRFKYVLVVSNQRGVAKGITRPEALELIHHNMLENITRAGGRIDRVYICTDMEQNSPNRKPNPGMGLQAKRDFEAIDFARSVMVGNKLSDMEFGRNLGSTTIFIPSTNPEVGPEDPRVDGVYPSLLDFAKDVEAKDRFHDGQ